MPHQILECPRQIAQCSRGIAIGVVFSHRTRSTEILRSAPTFSFEILQSLKKSIFVLLRRFRPTNLQRSASTQLQACKLIAIFTSSGSVSHCTPSISVAQTASHCTSFERNARVRRLGRKPTCKSEISFDSIIKGYRSTTSDQSSRFRLNNKGPRHLSRLFLVALSGWFLPDSIGVGVAERPRSGFRWSLPG